MKLDINMGSIWTMLTGTVLVVVYMFNTFVTAADFESYAVEDMFDKYYALEDQLLAKVEPTEEEIRKLERRMERLRTKICNIEPEWEECDGDS